MSCPDFDDMVTTESNVPLVNHNMLLQHAGPSRTMWMETCKPLKNGGIGIISTEQFLLLLSSLWRNQLGVYFTPPATAFIIIISPGSVMAAGGHFFFCYKQYMANLQTEMTSSAPAPAQGSTAALVHHPQTTARPCTLPQVV